MQLEIQQAPDWAAKPATRTTVKEATNKVRASRPRRVSDAPDGLIDCVKGLEKPCKTLVLLASDTVLIVFSPANYLGEGIRTTVRIR